MSAAFRLAAPAGLLLDRGRPLSFRFEGRPYDGYAGDTVASALAAHGVTLLSRSFKYHRARGVLSGAGHDANTLVQLPDVPNVAADRLGLEDGMDVVGQHYRGTLEDDRDTILERFARWMPVGFYYRAFFRPLGIWQKLWEPLIRARAGLGRIRLETAHDHAEKQHLFCDVAVIGAGPAGLSAALTAAGTGADVLLVSEESYLGGSLAHARFDADGKRGLTLRAELLAAIDAEPRIVVLRDATCTGWFADHWLSVVSPTRLYKVRARRTIFAVGAIEQPLVFRNNDLPGVMTGSAAQRLIRLYGVKPGRRAVVLAGNDHAYGVALDLADAGIEIAVIADLRPNRIDGPLAEAARERSLPVRAVQRVDSALPDRKRYRLQACRLDDASFECDLICMAAGFAPAYQLPAQAGAVVGYEPAIASFRVRPEPDSGVALAGAVGGIHDIDAVLADGRRAGAGKAGGTTLPVGPSVNLEYPIFPHPKGKEFVDFDEDLQIADLTNAVADGYREVELVKRFSTLGMGPSQGRLSALNAARVIADARDVPVAAVGVTTARPPVQGEPLALLAGRAFQVERRTPIHDRHLELGAHMIAVGAWWRPAFYGALAQRDAAIAAEIAAVHDNVGLLDVTTLGKIELRGPDAAQFLERIATFVYAGQAVGTIRYLLLTNEAGTLSDDGVAARIGPEHFYITATTGAVDNTFRQMQWWNAQWRMKVDIANVTGGYAAINVVGPRSRNLLAGLAPSIDLATANFPYLAVRDGEVAGIPARLLRIGFVGELGYEIHAPSSMGEALWDRLIEAGAPLGVRPVGVEAQRTLRLEKGHVIIGQDTDGVSTPSEVGMDWAVGKNKTSFVGSRSLALRGRQSAKRRLVGFTLPLHGPIPSESCVVVQDGEMAGVVTSAARSERCGHVIGLAYVPPELTDPGREFCIRLANGRDVSATVVTLPFYDPTRARMTC